MGSDTLVNVEGLRGSRFNDTLTGDSNPLNFIWGGAGDDAISSEAISSEMYGNGGNDTLTGSGSDLLRGGPGDDYLEGGDLNNNDLYGDAGNDTLVGGSADDYIYGATYYPTVNPGSDTVYAKGGADHIEVYDGVGDDYVDAGAGVDFCGSDVGDVILNCP
jgi:Ca2+-binding RTX toxin-like protein